MGFSGLAILSGNRLSFLDHLAPLCHILKIPLFVRDPYIAQMASLYYPDIEVSHEAGFSAYDYFLYVEPAKYPQGFFNFGFHHHHSSAKGIFAFHGNSDKSRDAFWIERLADEDVVLLYGEYFADFLKEKGVFERIKKPLFTGNFRLEYYLDHQSFFDALVKPFFSAKDSRKTIFYAPTWSFSNKQTQWNSNFFELFPRLVKENSSEYRWLVKPHPFFFVLYPDQMENLRLQYDQREDVMILPEIPLVFPFLQKADLFLGDYSSVGYDFLYFNRPLFFLSQRQDVFLHKTGTSIDFSQLNHIYSHFEKKDAMQELRAEVYHYAFGKKKQLTELKVELMEALL